MGNNETELIMDSTIVFEKTMNANTRIIAHQGGTSSGKTWSNLQYIILKALERPVHISVCSTTLPHLKKGALKDFIQILQNHGLYSEKYHNKTDNLFKIGSSIIEFFSLDEPGKVMGPRRDILFLNEANLISYKTFQQLLWRTKDLVILDYNPKDEESWIYDKVLTRPDCTLIKSTYLDNEFLDKNIVKEIEMLRETDPDQWQIYGLGIPGEAENSIYKPWKTIAEMPEGGDEFYGLDFGYNVPTAFVKCKLKDGNQGYIEEVIYQTYLTNSELIALLKTHVKGPPGQAIRTGKIPIYADAAEPGRIKEIQLAGFNCKPANKSVKDGIDRMKSLQIHVTKGSRNVIKERKSYKWQEDSATGSLTDIPIKKQDHAMDAIRYAFHTHSLKPSGKYAMR